MAAKQTHIRKLRKTHLPCKTRGIECGWQVRVAFQWLSTPAVIIFGHVLKTRSETMERKEAVKLRAESEIM